MKFWASGVDGEACFGITLDDPSTHDKYVVKLNTNDVRLIDRTGGTFLHTSRTNPQKVREHDIPEFLANSELGNQIDDKGKMDYTDYVLKVLIPSRSRCFGYDWW
jgi:ATP-dependent phosphofructokinase / diphosphate-dependent phosphofructokinase